MLKQKDIQNLRIGDKLRWKDASEIGIVELVEKHVITVRWEKRFTNSQTGKPDKTITVRKWNRTDKAWLWCSRA